LSGMIMIRMNHPWRRWLPEVNRIPVLKKKRKKIHDVTIVDETNRQRVEFNEYFAKLEMRHVLAVGIYKFEHESVSI
jgi:hypothetical protein